MKWSRVMLMAIAILTCSLMVLRTRRSANPPTGPLPSVELVESLSQLTTVRVELADVQASHIDGVTGGVEAAVLVKGGFSLTTDLSHASTLR